jgi:hypothetical protein
MPCQDHSLLAALQVPSFDPTFAVSRLAVRTTNLSSALAASILRDEKCDISCIAG